MFRSLGRLKWGVFFILFVGALSIFQPNLLELFSVRLASPVLRTFRAVTQKVGFLFSELISLREAQIENQQLREKLRGVENLLVKVEDQNHSLIQQLGNFTKMEKSLGEGQAAQVIAHDPKATFRSLTINRGSQTGVQLDQAVMAEGGLIGRVFRVGPRSAQVLLITDLRSVVDVLDLKSRARGSLSGKRKKLKLGREQWLTQAEYLSTKEEVRQGDLLVSSGLDGLYPKGIPVGVVRSVSKDSTGLFQSAEVKPYVELNKLEEVLVLNQTTDLKSDHRPQTTDRRLQTLK